MSNNKITPQEFHLLNDNPYIRTNCPQDHVTDAMVAQRVKAGNLVAGDRVMVQCFTHDYSELLAEAEYRVTSRKSEMRRDEVSDIVSRQYEQLTFEVARVGDWNFFSASPSGGEIKAVWKVGRQGWAIEVDGVEVGFETDKETANKIAAGELPLPEAA